MSIERDTTGRGFGIGKFTDRNGEGCSIQESSLADEDCIWLGVDDANPQVFIPNGQPSWRPLRIDVPPGGHTQYTTRMHLTREQVAELLPLLECFVKTGRLPNE